MPKIKNFYAKKTSWYNKFFVFCFKLILFKIYDKIHILVNTIIAEYIRNQLEEDYAVDQVTMKEYIDPFTGSKTK